MSDLGPLLRQGRATAGLSQIDLAARLGVTHPTISQRERGQTDMPTKQLEAFAAATSSTLLLTPDGWHLIEPERPTIDPNPERDQPLSRSQDRPYRLPLLGVASAGPGSWQEDGPVKTVSIASRWLTKLDGAIEVHGDSMEPLLESGDLVGARLGEEYGVGDVVIAVAAWGECLIKVFGGYREEEDLVILTSVNPEYAPIVGTSDELDVQGVAYGLLRTERLRV